MRSTCRIRSRKGLTRCSSGKRKRYIFFSSHFIFCLLALFSQFFLLIVQQNFANYKIIFVSKLEHFRLEMDDANRPSFLAMYFGGSSFLLFQQKRAINKSDTLPCYFTEQPDVAMHYAGPDSDMVNSALSTCRHLLEIYFPDSHGFFGNFFFMNNTTHFQNRHVSRPF